MVTNMMKQIKAKSLELMVIALGFVAGGVWNEAIIGWFKPLIDKGEGALPLTITAIIVTIVAVIMIVALTKLLGEKEEKKK